MSNYWINRDIKVSAIDDLDIDADNDYWEVYFGGPVDIVKVGVLATTAVANAATTVAVELYTRVTPGSSSGEVLADTFTVTDTTTIAAGKGVYRELDIPVAQATAEDSTLRDVGGAGPIHIEMGETFAMKVVEPADSGAVVAWIEYIKLPVAGTDLSNDYTEDVT